MNVTKLDRLELSELADSVNEIQEQALRIMELHAEVMARLARLVDLERSASQGRNDETHR